ncbi:eh domain-containing protein [Nannochloropsis oceanica]
MRQRGQGTAAAVTGLFIPAVGLLALVGGCSSSGMVVAAVGSGGVASWGGDGNAGGWRPLPSAPYTAASDSYPPYPTSGSGKEGRGRGDGGQVGGAHKGSGSSEYSSSGKSGRGGDRGDRAPQPSHSHPPPPSRQRHYPHNRPYQQQQPPSHLHPQRQQHPLQPPASKQRPQQEDHHQGGRGGGREGQSWEGGSDAGAPTPPSPSDDYYTGGDQPLPGFSGPPHPPSSSSLAPSCPDADLEASLLTHPPTPSALPSSSTCGPSSASPPPFEGNEDVKAPWHGADLSVLDKEQFFDELKRLYRKKVLPLELASKYAQFHSAPLNPADFEAKPMVLLLGQYSVGKTSFIRSLLQHDFPGQRVGPEPTTDRFMAVMHGPEARLVPGHALAMQADKPFRGVAAFGNNFLTKFEAAEVPAPILRNITLIDSPGILSGEKQRLGRDYDYQAVIQWFADRADLIIIMFDAHKLDISDELRVVMDALRIHQDKIRILLNKADQIDSQQLMRIYGALMWSLGKVVNTPEVCRVYIGSFWEHPLKHSQNRYLLEKEKADLLGELGGLPHNAVVRRINELVKRARSVKVHAYLIHYLRKQVPTVFGKSEKQAKLLQTLPREFVACARRYGLPLGDFPDINKFRARLGEVKDLRKFPKLDKAMVYEMDRVFSHDIPKLLEKASRRPEHGEGAWEGGSDPYRRGGRR